MSTFCVYDKWNVLWDGGRKLRGGNGCSILVGGEGGRKHHFTMVGRTAGEDGSRRLGVGLHNIMVLNVV